MVRISRIATAILFVVGSALTTSTAQTTPTLLAQGRHWRCDVIQKWECELPTGCKPALGEPIWLLLDFRDLIYQRCDRFGCDKYAMQVRDVPVNGSALVFTYVSVPQRPDMFLKIGLAGYFIDVAALGVSAMNSMGTCGVQK